MSETPKHYRVVKAYESPYPHALVFRKRSHVKVIKEYQDDPQWPNWFWCVGQNKTEAWIPAQYLQIDGEKGILNRDFNAVELSVVAGEILQVHEMINGFSWAENVDGKCGWVPMKYLMPLERQ